MLDTAARRHVIDTLTVDPADSPTPATVGNIKDATRALDLIRSNAAATWDGFRKDGWVYQGSGAFRVAWRSPDGVIYKGLRDLYMDDGNQMLGEAMRWRMLRRHRNWAGLVPEHTLYTVDGRTITAVERIPHLRREQPQPYGPEVNRRQERAERAGHHVGASDLGHDNIRYRADGRPVLVDLGNTLTSDPTTAGCAICREA